LEGISSIEAANAFMPRFIEDYNTRFAKEPRNAHNAHRGLRADEELDLIFCWRELRKVTKALTLSFRVTSSREASASVSSHRRTSSRPSNRRLLLRRRVAGSGRRVCPPRQPWYPELLPPCGRQTARQWRT
jgi:hypothetical protein